MDWRLTDLASIAIGLAVELQALIYYDKILQPMHQTMQAEMKSNKQISTRHVIAR